MELLVNDLSICGQFSDIASFQSAIGRVMHMRSLAQKFGRELHCHRNMTHVQVSKDLSLSQAIQYFQDAEKKAFMLWLTRLGPFWDDRRAHGADDYLECDGQIVTDTAIGETSFNCLHGTEYQLVSLTPSSWELSPLSVWWRCASGNDQNVEIENHTSWETLEKALRLTPEPTNSWEQLAHVSRLRFSKIVFSSDSFDPLRGLPFSPGAAQAIMARMDVLDRMKYCFDENGERTPDGHRLYQEYFTGDKAWFSDSSETEINEFKTKLTFKHPDVKGENFLCAMHGKVKTPQIRIHFSWPIRADVPLYVVYVGPKITRR